jgi:SPP1 gp7 family putative phage head morphogenesis protein
MGVPPAIVGIYEYANYANAREQTRTFWRNRVLPLASRITSAINEQLAPQYGDGVRVVLETSSASALQPDYAELASIAAQLVQQGVMTRDEVRETLFGLEPLGGDWGNGWWGSITTVPLAGAETTAAATRAIAAGAGSTEERQAAREPTNSKAQAVTMRRLSEGGRKALYKGFNEVRNRHERKAKSLVVRWYEGLEAQVLGRLREAEKALGPSIVRAPKLELLLFSVEEATQALEELLGPELLAAYEAAGEEAMILAELDIGFDMSTQVAERLLAGRRLVMRSIAETAQERLRGSLADGLAGGETVSQLTTRALEWAKAGKEVYAETVARTETGVVMNAAALDGYQQAGATHKEWLAIMDDRTRDTHASLDGAVVPIAETFDVGGFAASGPGDPSLPVEEVANCRCTTAPVFEE